MLTGIESTIRSGHTGHDHLIDSIDRAAATDAVAGIQFRRSSDALLAAQQAYLDACDTRVRTARVQVTLRTARGDRITVG